MNECPHCNHHNPPQAVTCRVCNLSLPRDNAPSIMHSTVRPKLAVFDLDKTLFDLSRRERAARRQGLKEGSTKWYEFLNQNKYILMDTAIPGTVSFVKALSADGYTIAYLSGRPSSVLAATKTSLQETGFPIDSSLDRDLVFLHSGKGSIPNITKHKKYILTHLKQQYDIHFFFDDTPEFREAAKSLFIPGVYPSIAAYTGKEERTSDKKRSKKTRSNPGHGEDLCHRTTAIDPYTGVYYACSKPEGHSGRHDFSIEMVAPDIDPDGDNPFENPAPKPRKKRNKAGKMVKEPVKKYMDRFMGDAKMNDEFPDRSQRFAVGLSYARKFYGDATVNRAYPPRSNPSDDMEVLNLNPIPTLSKTAKANLRKIVPMMDIQAEQLDLDVPGDQYSMQLLSAVKRELRNPPVTGRDATRDLEIKHMNRHKIKSHDFTREELQPFSLPINLLKKMSSYLHGSREYMGIFDMDKSELLVGTGFGIGSVGVGPSLVKYCFDENVPLMFHTHPTRRNKAFGMDFDWQLPSAPDYMFTQLFKVWGGVDMHCVVNKFGIHILRPYVRPRSKLAKLLNLPKSKFTKAKAKEADELIMADINAVRKKLRSGAYFRDFIERLGLDELQMFDLEQSADIQNAYVNSLQKSLAMDHEFFAFPIAGVKWTKQEGDALEGEYSSVRANPGNVAEAKEMYKQFHQKAAKNVQKKKVNFGDTWVGLGKAWSIGYRSGKETGNDTQKYIHNFGVDEETGKQFKEPDLYYVKNKDGSQMMVIMGGDWYIDMDEDGKMSWIYI